MNTFPSTIRLICLPYAGGSTACHGPPPAMVFSAIGEDNTEKEIYAWSRKFAGAIGFERFEGSHFFSFLSRRKPLWNGCCRG